MSHKLLFTALVAAWAGALPFISCAASADEFVIETVAGTGRPGNNGDDGLATQLNVDQPFGVEVGPDGALYITEVGQHRVRRLDLTSGKMTTVAGSGKPGYAGDGGPATKALLNEPYEVRFDLQGNLVFVEMQNHLVRRVDRKTGVVSTIAGKGTAGYSGDGRPAKEATFRQPHSIAFDQAGALFIADIANHRIRRIDPQTGLIDTVAGNGDKKLPVAGTAAKGAPILGPRALAVAGDTLWIGLREGNSIWKLDLRSGLVAIVAGQGKQGFSGDGGNPRDATFAGPKGVAIDKQGRLYVVDTENQAIREIDERLGVIRTIAGTGPAGRGYGGDGGPAIKALLDRPHGICTGGDGTIYIGDTNNHRVRRLRREKGTPMPQKNLPVPGETFLIQGRPAFVMLPAEHLRKKPQPWIWYAPTLPGLPDQHEKWLHEKFIAAGIAVAGIDVGESYGNSKGREEFTALHKELTEKRGFAAKPCLLGRSRGGLMVCSWAVEHPESVAGIAGIYPVLDFRTYPGLDKAAPAYGISAKELGDRSVEHNPIERVESLAKARVPAFFIHGDVDTVVPLEQNSAEFLRRYEIAGAGASVKLVVAKGQGHNYWEGFFRCQELVDFAIERARDGAGGNP